MQNSFGNNNIRIYSKNCYFLYTKNWFWYKKLNFVFLAYSCVDFQLPIQLMRFELEMTSWVENVETNF